MKLSVLFTLLFGFAILLPPAIVNVAAQDVGGDQIGEVSHSEHNHADAEQAPRSVGERIGDAKERLDTDPQAQQATDHILSSIRDIGNKVVAVPGFYWIAFAMMTAGLVSFLLQLVLGKLIMLTQSHFSIVEIMSDAMGFLISLIGLTLLTQSATNEGLVIDRPSFVVTAAGLGAFVGLIFYFRGQTQELREARALAKNN